MRFSNNCHFVLQGWGPFGLYVWDGIGAVRVIEFSEQIGLTYPAISNDGCRIAWCTSDRIHFAELDVAWITSVEYSDVCLSNPVFSKISSIAVEPAKSWTIEFSSDSEMLFFVGRTGQTPYIGAHNFRTGTIHRSEYISDWKANETDLDVIFRPHPSIPNVVMTRFSKETGMCTPYFITSAGQIKPLVGVKCQFVEWNPWNFTAVVWSRANRVRQEILPTVYAWNLDNPESPPRKLGAHTLESIWINELYVDSEDTLYSLDVGPYNNFFKRSEVSSGKVTILYERRSDECLLGLRVLPRLLETSLKTTSPKGLSVCIFQLAPEVVYQIMKFLDSHSLQKMGQTCKSLMDISSSDVLWRDLATHPDHGWGPLMYVLKQSGTNKENTWKHFYIGRTNHLSHYLSFVSCNGSVKVTSLPK